MTPPPPKQCSHTMNTVRSCFAAAIACLVVAIGWWSADAVVCCNSTSVVSGGGGVVASCRNKNRTFHTVETIGSGTCDDDRTAMPFWKCCPPGRPYDPELRVCGPAGEDGVEYQRKMMQRLQDGFRAAADAVMVGYYYKPPKCDDTQVLVDVPAVEVRRLMEADPSAVELPQSYCFDLTPSDGLVARTCRPRDQYCGPGRYTCVNKCCNRDQMIDFDVNGRKCKHSKKSFTMSAYDTDVDGRPVVRSNSTVLLYDAVLRCSRMTILNDGFMLTTNGSLYLTHKSLIPDRKFCLKYHAKAGSPVAIICTDDYENYTGLTSLQLVFRTSNVMSIICLVITLFVYAKLSYLRNAHGNYVMFYLVCLLVLFVLKIIRTMIWNDINSSLCIPFGYFSYFALLTTICWLNVICFDIYWMLRYNNSINKNTSISVRTIMYHIYCWGFSSICVSTGYLFQHSQHETLLKLAPDIGDFTCYFYLGAEYGVFIFYLLPSCVLLTANLILFLLTAIHCSRIKSELNKFQHTNDSITEMFPVYREKFVTSIKLFLVMGIPFFFSMLTRLFQSRVPGELIIKDIFDAITILQGVFVFIIFVAKRKVIMNLRKKFSEEKVYGKSSLDTVSQHHLTLSLGRHKS